MTQINCIENPAFGPVNGVPASLKRLKNGMVTMATASLGSILAKENNVDRHLEFITSAILHPFH